MKGHVSTPIDKVFRKLWFITEHIKNPDIRYHVKFILDFNQLNITCVQLAEFQDLSVKTICSHSFCLSKIMLNYIMLTIS